VSISWRHNGQHVCAVSISVPAQPEQTTWQHGVMAAETSVTRFMHIGQLYSAIAAANLTKMLKERVHMRLSLVLIYVGSYFIKAYNQLQNMPCLHKKMTPHAWVARLYTTSALILLISLVVFGVISGGNDDSIVTLEYAFQNTSVVLGSRAFNLSTAYIIGLLAAVVLQTIVALAPSTLEPHLQSGRNPMRWVMLAFTAPALQTVTLVGIAEVTDVWAVFGAISITGLSLLMLFLIESVPHKTCTVWTGAFGLVAVFVAYWALVWRASGTFDVFTLGVSCFMNTMLVLAFAATYNWNRWPYKREAVMQSATMLFELGMPWLWAASSRSSSTAITTWTTFMVLSAFAIGSTWAAVASSENIVGVQTPNDKKEALIPMVTVDSEEDEGDPYLAAALECASPNAVLAPFE
jgi:hypothetical protein